MKVIASILNWNNQIKTTKCLQSVLAMEILPTAICITDNDSVSFDEKKLLDIYPTLQIFRNDSNVGYAAGHLQALDYAREQKADLFLMLNNDVKVERATLGKLVEAFDKNGKGIYGSASIDKDGMLSELGMWNLNHDGDRFYCDFKEIEILEKDRFSTLRVANVFGHCLLIPMEIIDQRGFMDTSFFLYYEETDYCLGLLKFGIPSYWVGASQVFHEKEGSTNDHSRLKEIIEYYLYRNLFLFLRRHASIRLSFDYVIRFGMRFLSANFAKRKKVRPLTKKHLKGIFHGLVGKTGKYYAPEDFL